MGVVLILATEFFTSRNGKLLEITSTYRRLKQSKRNKNINQCFLYGILLKLFFLLKKNTALNKVNKVFVYLLAFFIW